jgi:Fic/DOC family
MEEAIGLGEADGSLTAGDIRAIHRTLIAGEPDRVAPGEYRREQNWIGGRPRLADRRSLRPASGDRSRSVDGRLGGVRQPRRPAGVAQAAIAHAFETIHPFLDGNGRVGRCLIHVVLRRRGVATRFVPPVSIVLAARANQCIAGHVGFREGRISEWCASFAGAASEARGYQGSWRKRSGGSKPTGTSGLVDPVAFGCRANRRSAAGPTDRVRGHYPCRDRCHPPARTRRPQPSPKPALSAKSPRVARTDSTQPRALRAPRGLRRARRHCGVTPRTRL